jgi:hypothetical protein
MMVIIKIFNTFSPMANEINEVFLNALQWVFFVSTMNAVACPLVTVGVDSKETSVHNTGSKEWQDRISCEIDQRDRGHDDQLDGSR